jgi:hypothetical protein
MKEYPVVVVPECDFVPDELRGALLDYVRNGGNLLVVGPQSVAIFKDVLGVTFEGEPAETTAYVKGSDALSWLGGIWQGVRLEAAENVGERYPTTDTRQGAACAASLNRLGKGRIAGIYGPLGSVHYRTHYPAVREFIGKAMAHLFPTPMVELEGPPYIDVALRRNESGILVHLTNLAGMQTAPRYALIDAIPPVGSLKLRVRLDEKPQSVSAVPNDCPLESHWGDGVLHVTVANLEVHSIIVIQ